MHGANSETLSWRLFFVYGAEAHHVPQPNRHFYDTTKHIAEVGAGICSHQLCRYYARMNRVGENRFVALCLQPTM